MIRRMSTGVGGPSEAASRRQQRLFVRTDDRTHDRRWRSLNNFEPDWDERTRLIAGLVPPGTRVLEFGAGRRQLERYLPPDCTYIPSDLVQRGRRTLVCDLNRRPLPRLAAIRPEVAVFGGVMEYVADVPSVIQWICRSVSTCIASYECVPDTAGTQAPIGVRIQRARMGWMSDHTEPQLHAFFREVGFACTGKTIWQTAGGDEPIFVFSRDWRSLRAAGPTRIA